MSRSTTTDRTNYRADQALGRARAAPTVSRTGCIVLVVGADPAALAMLLDAARRRFQGEHRVSFPVVACTRRGLYGGHEIVLSRRAFADVMAAGGFVATWRVGDAMAGLPASARADLHAGMSVVIGVTHTDICDGAGSAGLAWPERRVVRVTSHTDLTRVALSPRACLGRMLGPSSTGFARFKRAPDAVEARVHVESIGGAVSAITTAIESVIPRGRPRRANGARPQRISA